MFIHTYSKCSDNIIRLFSLIAKLDRETRKKCWIDRFEFMIEFLLRMKKFWQTKNWMRPAQQWGLIQFIFISLNFLPRHFHKGFSKGGLFSEYTIIAQNLWFLFSQALNLTLLIWKIEKSSNENLFYSKWWSIC